MRKFLKLVIAFSVILLGGCKKANDANSEPPRIAVTGLAIENLVYSLLQNQRRIPFMLIAPKKYLESGRKRDKFAINFNLSFFFFT